MQEGSPFSTPSPAFIVSGLFNDGNSDWHEVIPQCSVDLHFSKNWSVGHHFMYLFAFMSSLEKMLIEIFC